MFNSEFAHRDEQNLLKNAIHNLCFGLDITFEDISRIVAETLSKRQNDKTNISLLETASDVALTFAASNPHYGTIASRLIALHIHQKTKHQFSDVIKDFYNNVTNINNKISEKCYKIVCENESFLNNCIVQDRDFTYSYPTMKNMLIPLLRVNDEIVERPQQMLIRVALEIHQNNIKAAAECYELMSKGYFTLSMITMKYPVQLPANSYIMCPPEDSINGLFKCISEYVHCAKYGANVALPLHNVRGQDSPIAGLGCNAKGLVPLIRVFNSAKLFVNNTQTNLSIYLEPWHIDILDFLNLKQVNGKEEYRARELQYCLCIPDIFMERIQKKSMWSLMCPYKCPALLNTYGENFQRIYEKYETDGDFLKRIPARELWKKICLSQIETGSPVLIFKDALNRNRNSQSTSSDQDHQLNEYNFNAKTSGFTTAHLILDSFINVSENIFDYEKLQKVTKFVVNTLNVMQDNQKLKHIDNQIAVGTCGLADLFLKLQLSFDSIRAHTLNMEIYETICYGSLEASCDLVTNKNQTVFHPNFDQLKLISEKYTLFWNWSELEEKIKNNGLKHVSLMAFTSHPSSNGVFAKNYGVEPYSSYVETWNTNSQTISIINQDLCNDLKSINLLTPEIAKKIIENNGSIQNIDEIPAQIKRIYKTGWELSQRQTIELASDRAAFLDRDQSLHFYILSPTIGKLSSMHFYTWLKKIRTGICSLNFRH